MIHELIGFSNQTYDRANRCGNCPNNCPETGNCEQCLENVHYGIDGRIYNCTNILSFYVGKYAYKYSSEIGHVFNYPRFGVFQEYNILSLGCGPCTDYFGILNSIISNNRNIRLNYLGIDINNDWNPIHNWMLQRLGNTYGVLTMDVYDFLANPAHYLERYVPNIIIVNYLLSDLLKAGRDINVFINKLEENIFRNLATNSYIIINDYNRGLNANDPRTYYSNFVHAIRENSDVKCFYCHYRHNINRYFKYGYQHASNALLFQVQPEYRIFNPWEFCSSAQLIIKKN